ncbi:hypothetical protein PPL_09300 [Heterostelium album PN500]|uniref:Fluoroacetyl-CoA-specific thioesterase-like domain-containing protein n=1 Tax=Heterostelium pallidum (strain ATCC 26659 / Pp 5 / PN500) TaxID=670386 RepID=D3BL68_HETP5|nr:hypothetical protein PPL_09300 [Heterostelium album PN500]EFA77802.1 hypothetical protein PPL_09300 [Heterostelium album PN500]|eukprot:XP_020429930.1 hypothetical protein PPL_09300 [Heterostelium album PN500]
MSSPNLTAKVGDTHEVKSTVEEKHLANIVGSGDIEVFSTPSMIALMEKASVDCIKDKMGADWSSVGTSVNIAHLAATPLSLEVSAVATITAIDGKKVSFKVEASDATGKIGEGTHERFIVQRDRFKQRTYEKLEKK